MRVVKTMAGWTAITGLLVGMVSAGAQQSTLSTAVNGTEVSVQDAVKYPPVVHLTAEQDHQRTMGLLGIKELRTGRDGNHPDSPNYANYDEAKANPYPELPDPLILNDGKRVKSAKVWWQVRRPQIVKMFDREIYGRVPAHARRTLGGDSDEARRRRRCADDHQDACGAC
jgi:hypothetical protein